MTAFFDTSAIVALADSEEPRHSWSLREFTTRQALGPIVINDVVYAEISAGMTSRDEVDKLILRFGFERAVRDDSALFSAGQRFKCYKTGPGNKTNVLPDYFIGATARSLGIPLVTANPKDFRRFFQGLIIVHPGGEETVP
jgi:predicted nucleic acid-binding protein